LEKKEFTLINAFNQFWQVWENGDKRSLTCIGLYFYLVKVWNACGRPISFRRQNTLVCAELSLSKPTLDNNRNQLKQMGLIDFYSKGKGDPNITYEIIDVSGEVKKLYYQPPEPEVKEEVKKANNFTSPFTSPFTSSFDTKQSTENETYVVIDGKEKPFSVLKNLTGVDEGLRRRWQDQGFAAAEFFQGFAHFMNLKHGQTYPDFKEFRKNFYFWIPNYHHISKRTTKHEPNGSGHPAGPRKGDTAPAGRKGGSIAALQALKQRTGNDPEGGTSASGPPDDHGGAEWAQAEVV
jgi:hypothetical protein